MVQNDNKKCKKLIYYIVIKALIYINLFCFNGVFDCPFD